MHPGTDQRIRQAGVTTQHHGRTRVQLIDVFSGHPHAGGRSQHTEHARGPPRLQSIVSFAVVALTGDPQAERDQHSARFEPCPPECEQHQASHRKPESKADEVDDHSDRQPDRQEQE